MNFFTTEDKVKEFGNFPALDNARVTTHLPSARNKIIKEITKAEYDRIYSLGVNNDDYKNLVITESYMCLMYLVPAINIQSSGNGVTKAMGSGDARQEVLSESDVDALRKRYYEMAMDILSDYILPVDSDSDKKPDILKTSKVGFASI